MMSHAIYSNSFDVFNMVSLPHLWRHGPIALKTLWSCIRRSQVIICLSTVDPRSDDGRQTEQNSVSVGIRRPALTDEGVGAVVGALATLAVLLFVVAGLLAWRRQRQFGVHRVLKCLDGPLQATSVTTRPPTSPRNCSASQFNGTTNGLAVAAKVLHFMD